MVLGKGGITSVWSRSGSIFCLASIIVPRPIVKIRLGVLEAFQRAFPNKNENVGLIIKSIGNVDDYPDIRETIRQGERY